MDFCWIFPVISKFLDVFRVFFPCLFQAKREQLINEIRGLVAADGCIWDVFERWNG